MDSLVGLQNSNATESTSHGATSLAVDKTNYVLGFCYVLLGTLAFVQALLKYKVEKKIKTNVVFPAEICILCVVRATYFFTGLTTWATHTAKYENAAMFFIDIIPELIFVAIYLLLVSSWGVTWAKARAARPFAPSQFWIAYAFIIGFLLLLTLILSISIGEAHLTYETVIHWEGAYLLSLSIVCVLAALTFGIKLYKMLKRTVARSRYLSHVMKQLLLLVLVASISFALKGAWVFSISTSIRAKWIAGQWNDVQFGIFWFFYYFITEILPFYVIWLVLQRKETNEIPQTPRTPRKTPKKQHDSAEKELLGREETDTGNELPPTQLDFFNSEQLAQLDLGTTPPSASYMPAPSVTVSFSDPV